jgi:hypothetical protein
MRAAQSAVFGVGGHLSPPERRGKKEGNDAARPFAHLVFCLMMEAEKGIPGAAHLYNVHV